MSEINSYLSFRIGEEYFATSVTYIHNIIEVPQITEMPEMPDFLLGVINLRGKVLPVIDSRIKFGIVEQEITNNTCIVVMEINIDKKLVLLGMLVDEVSEVFEIDANDIKEAPKMGSAKKADHIIGVVPDNEKFIMILEMEKVFNSEELKVPVL